MTISLKQASQELEVSLETVRNWIRSGILEKNSKGVLSASVGYLKKKLSGKDPGKLDSRANKSRSARNFIPYELLSSKDDRILLRKIISEISGQNIGIDGFIDFLLSLKRGKKNSDNLLFNNILSRFPDITNIEPALIYQSLSTEGTKSKKGSYYTPPGIVNDVMSVLKEHSPSVICDPCCGTGSFLKQAAEIFQDSLITGLDTDPAAINIAEEMLERKGHQYFRLHCTDSLLYEWDNDIDAVVTNPPWGAFYNRDEKKKLSELFPEAGSNDSLEYFLRKTFRSVKKGGFVSFILPESFLYVERFSKIREFVLKNIRLKKITIYGRIFSGVFTPVIRIDMLNSVPDTESRTEIEFSGTENGNFSIHQKFYLDEPFCRLNVKVRERDRSILNRMDSGRRIFLRDHALWNLGIVTGNNNEFVREQRSEKFSVPVITGKNVGRFVIRGKKRFLNYDTERLQQVPRTPLYSREKLIYKFISEVPVFAYDDTGIVPLNSANVLIPQLPNYPIKAVPAVLNSELVRFYYSKRFTSLKVLRSALESIPFPENPPKNIIDKLVKFSDDIISGRDVNKAEREIDGLVKELYGV